MRVVDERTTLATRLKILKGTVLAIFLALAACFWYLQLAPHERFREMAENNHQRLLALAAPRGAVLDRNGQPIVENRYSFNISVLRDSSRDLGHTARLIAEQTGVPLEQITDALARNHNVPKYRPIVVVRDASLGQVTRVAARRYELPDVLIEQVPMRAYPKTHLAAHALGYVGEISEAQLSQPAYRSLGLGDVIGQSGLEQRYNGELMGRDGARYVIVNSVGREVTSGPVVDPVPGRRVQLTIDIDLQAAAEEAFAESGFNGAAVFLDPKTGEVLAMASRPAYDPNAFSGGISRGLWQALTTSPLRPLQNRAIQGRYSPGSTFKIVVATAALEEGVVTPAYRVHCSGGASFYGRYFRCWRAGGHGTVDFRRAIEQSCNVYFYTIGNMLGVDRMHRWATRLGIGVKSGIDLPHETEGIMPSTQWKRKTTGEKWYAGETISVAIGQGQVSVTPISLAVMMATLANGGTRVVPHVVRAVEEGGRWTTVAPPPASAVTLKPSTIAAVHEGLWLVVNRAGTGGRARIPGYDVGGKTGTAQVISLQGAKAAGGSRDVRDHGWFVFFAPTKQPRIAGVVFAEHSEHGYLAAPIARHVMETYFAKREGRPLPPLHEPKPTLVADRETSPAIAEEPRATDQPVAQRSPAARAQDP
jgi:penicillin-binding protein 2